MSTRTGMRNSMLGAMLALAFGFLLAGPPAAPAVAQEEEEKSFELPSAYVVADVRSDGSVLVTEQITYDFTGSFEGGYREIPLKDEMSVTELSVSEGGKRYASGASAGLGSSGAPGTYGSVDLGDSYRIVWHYRATDEERTFTLRYRLEGLAVAHDDVVDLSWQAWGEEWQEPLGSLQAEVVLPTEASTDEVKVYGHPASVGAKTSLLPGGTTATLFAVDVPARQFVELRVVFPRELLTSTGGARVEQGEGRQKIMNEEDAEARSEAREAQQQRLKGLLALLLIFGFGGVVLTLGFVSWWFGLPGGGGTRWYGGHGDSSSGGGGGSSGGGGDGGGGGGGGAW